MIADLGDPDFARVRVGIGRPPAGRDAADYVLSDFSRAERQGAARPASARAADAVEAIVARRPDRGDEPVQRQAETR